MSLGKTSGVSRPPSRGQALGDGLAGAQANRLISCADILHVIHIPFQRQCRAPCSGRAKNNSMGPGTAGAGHFPQNTPSQWRTTGLRVFSPWGA